MKITVIRQLPEETIAVLFQMWNAEFPRQVICADCDEFRTKLRETVNPTHYICYLNSNELAGWLMTFDRDGERFFVLLVKSDHQRKKIGSNLIAEVKKNENEIVGWVVPNDINLKADGQPYRSPLHFYQKQGFELTNEISNKNDLSSVKVKWHQ